MNSARTLILFFGCILAMACGSVEPESVFDPPDADADAGGAVDGALRDGAASDAGRPDAGVDDSGRPDAGVDDSGRPDTGVDDSGRPDAGVDDSGPPDSGVGDAARPDADPSDAGSMCNAGAIRRIPRSPAPVMAGTYCDALYACASDRAEATRIQAASSRFVCTAGTEPASGCSAFTCTYTEPGRREPYDAADLLSICPVTVLAPMPVMTCVVFI